MMARRPFGKRGWTPARLPDLSGKVAVITGANSGIGLEAARELGGRGVKQLWICRNPAKADAARQEVLAAHPGADIEVFQADLGDLDTVRTAAEAIRQKVDGIDAVINNAGIMMLPERELTPQGCEKQLGVNHMAHFALNGWLADLVEARGGRFVGTSSVAHRAGRIDQADLLCERSYGAITAYGQSKLANLMYVFELDRRLKQAGKRAVAIGCHPGYSATNLQTTGPSSFMGSLMSLSNALVAQKAAHGAWPTLLAAFEPEAERGGYYGPTSFGDSRGPVGLSTVAKQARDAEVAAWLWERSVEMTGVDWAEFGL